LPPTVDVHAVAPVDIAGVLSTAVDVWVVEGAVAGDRLREALYANGAPVVVRVSSRGAGPWRSHQMAGRVDVVASGAPFDELLAHIIGAANRALLFSALSARLAVTVAHDLRSPLQGIRMVLMAQQREGNLSGEAEEDNDMMLSASETIELLLHGLYNLGRRPAHEGAEVVDLTALAVNEAGRKWFQERLQLHTGGALPVRANASDLAQAVLDLFRVAVQLCPNHRRVVARTERVGDVAMLKVEVPVWPPVVAHADALMSRDVPLLLRSTRTRLPFACLAFARDVLRMTGGDLTARGDAERELVLVICYSKLPPAILGRS
jgi:signal transduction histidine kinase